MSSDLSAGPEWALPVRLLSSVAVVGRDNEPIYLRGDLCDCVSSPKSSPAASPNKAGERMDTGEDASAVGHEASTEGETSPSNKKRGIFGRIKGAMGKTSAADGGEKEELDGDDTDVPDEASNDDDLDTDDPFGFFGSTTIHDGNSKPHLSIGNFSGIPNPMTLTQQLVLHASLDRFEEMASRSNKGGAVRWRTPGSTGANAMWMGLLCEVEERWTVYGYLTNTGIKFMVLVENIFLNEDGSRQDHAVPSFANSFPPVTSTNLSRNTTNREADLKKIFAKVHDLYVRHTMNPFSKLRGPIKSRVFDEGIVEMAQSFNKTALAQIPSLDGSGGPPGGESSLAWM